jgi:hypothetical protein
MAIVATPAPISAKMKAAMTGAVHRPSGAPWM